MSTEDDSETVKNLVPEPMMQRIVAALEVSADNAQELRDEAENRAGNLPRLRHAREIAAYQADEDEARSLRAAIAARWPHFYPLREVPR
jgi:hypothetical protein